jgi:hypothetical protein
MIVVSIVVNILLEKILLPVFGLDFGLSDLKGLFK